MTKSQNKSSYYLCKIKPPLYGVCFNIMEMKHFEHIKNNYRVPNWFDTREIDFQRYSPYKMTRKYPE